MMGGLSWLMTGTTAGLIPMMMLCHEHEEDRGCDPNLRQARRIAPKVGRIDPCSRGSGKKYKRCCGGANRG